LDDAQPAMPASQLLSSSNGSGPSHDHRHSGIGMHTAFDVHHGLAEAVRAARADTLTAAYNATPERFVRQPPEPPALPGTTWINRPEPTDTTDSTNQTRS
jgi:putative transposase